VAIALGATGSGVGAELGVFVGWGCAMALAQGVVVSLVLAIALGAMAGTNTQRLAAPIFWN